MDVSPASTYLAIGALCKSGLMGNISFTNDKIVLGLMSGNPLAQVQIPSLVKKYSWWSTIIRPAFYVLVYGKHYFASWSTETFKKKVLFFLW